MSLDPVISLQRVIATVGCEEVQLKLFDLEHFGVLIQATVTSALMTGTSEYTLGVTEREVHSINDMLYFAVNVVFLVD